MTEAYRLDDVALLAESNVQGHNEVLTEGIDGRVGNLHVRVSVPKYTFKSFQDIRDCCDWDAFVCDIAQISVKLSLVCL